MRVLSKLVGSRSAVLAMALSSVLAMVGCASNDSSSTGSSATATPTFSPGAGTYNKSQTVTIADTTQGAVLYCTTDGSTPTTSSPQCGQPTTVYQTQFLQAIAVAPGKSASPVAAAAYTITLNAAATPTFSPAGGTFTGTQTVTISDATSGANVYYTLDGTVPSANSTLYATPISISKNTTLSAIAVASGYANSGINSATYTIQAQLPAPVVSGLSPTSANAGGAALTLTVNGTNFVSGATVLWNGAPLTTTFGTATQLTAAVPANLIANAGTANVAVSQPSGISGVAAFTINAVAPTISSLSPATTAAGGGVFTLTVNGTNFVSGASVNWNGAPLTTTFGTATQLTASVPANLIATAGTASVTVTEPAGTSNASTFTVTAVTPTISSLSPSSATVGGVDFPLTVSGTNFVSGASVNWNGAPLTTTFGSATQLTASIPASLIATVGTASVTVVEPAGTSPAKTFTITGLGVPTISGLSQTTAAVGGAGFTLTVNGTNFDSTAVVNWNSTAGTTALNSTLVSATKVTAAVPASLLTTAGQVNVTVKTAAGETASMTITVAPMISGVMASGTTPITNASVQLWAAGSTGYSMGATAVGSPVTTNATTGAFAIPYDCSTLVTPGDQLYLVATGTQSNVVLMSALGSCATLSGSYIVNEATTVASAYALQQFMAADGTIGAAGNSVSYKGLSNAFKTVSNLVDLSAGTVRDHTPDYSTNLAGDPNILNNSTVPQARINTLANALNACTSNGNGCSGLFSAATPGSGSAPGNTLAAILNIAQNPGNNPGDILAVANGSTAFTPALPSSATPSDWTLALTFTGGGLGFAPGVAVPWADGSSTPSGKFLHSAIAIDSTGNVWVTGFHVNPNNISSSNGVDAASGMLAGFNNLGKPLTNASSLTGFGGFISIQNVVNDTFPNGGTQAPHSIAVDLSGNLWIEGGGNIGGGQSGTGTGGALSKISYSGSTFSVPFSYLPSGANPTPVVVDGSGSLWVLSDAGLEKLGSSGNVQLGPDSTFGNNPPGSPYSYGTLQNLQLDSTGAGLWSSDSQYGDLFHIDASTGLSVFDYFAANPGNYTPLVPGPSQSGGNVGNVYGCGSNTQSLDVYNEGSTSPLNTFPIPTGRGCGVQMVMDGAGHIFTITGSTGSTATPGTVDEFSVGSSGITLVSPAATGYTGTSSTESPVINPDPGIVMPTAVWSNFVTVSTNSVTGAALDGSGNLWVLNEDTGTTTSPGNVLVEFIGIGAPVVTPTSTALSFAQVGVRP